ncbi:MAG: hypothetical protein ACR2ME_07120 [Acidimicrobiia bacterium]
MALKTQAEQFVLIASPYTTTQLGNLLESQYQAILARHGYRFHDRPTNVYIYVYDREADTARRYRDWRAMLRQDYAREPQLLLKEGDIIRELMASDATLPKSDESGGR